MFSQTCVLISGLLLNSPTDAACSQRGRNRGHRCPSSAPAAAALQPPPLLRCGRLAGPNVHPHSNDGKKTADTHTPACTMGPGGNNRVHGGRGAHNNNVNQCMPMRALAHHPQHPRTHPRSRPDACVGPAHRPWVPGVSPRAGTGQVNAGSRPPSPQSAPPAPGPPCCRRPATAPVHYRCTARA